MTLKSKLSLKLTSEQQQKLQQGIKERTTVTTPVLEPATEKRLPVKGITGTQPQKSYWQTREEVMIATLASMQEKYPLVFNTNPPVPLAIGVDRQIRKELGFDPSIIGKFMSWYTNRSEYLRQHLAGAARIDLAGSQNGTVTEAQATAAIARLEKALWRETNTKEAEGKYNTRLEEFTKINSNNGLYF